MAARSNGLKADQDPAEWLPPAPDALCRYGAEWTATKLRWDLAVDEAEQGRLLDIAAACGGTDVEFTKGQQEASGCVLDAFRHGGRVVRTSSCDVSPIPEKSPSQLAICWEGDFSGCVAR